MKKRKKEKAPMEELEEMSDCCKMVAHVKNRDIGKIKAEADAVVERLQVRVSELEKLAFEKARVASGLEGEIAGLKHKLEEALRRTPVPATATPAVVTPAQPAVQLAVKKRTENCVVCNRECISMCPECKAPVCGRQECGRAHGHGSMYSSST